MEADERTKLYEGMFLVDSARAADDWDGTLSAVRTILEKAGSEIVSIDKWDDRRLAYNVDGRSRGTYILSYFKVDGRKISAMERDVVLSERVLRALFLRCDSPEQISSGKKPAADRSEPADSDEADDEVVAEGQAADEGTADETPYQDGE